MTHLEDYVEQRCPTPVASEEIHRLAAEHESLIDGFASAIQMQSRHLNQELVAGRWLPNEVLRLIVIAAPDGTVRYTFVHPEPIQ